MEIELEEDFDCHTAQSNVAAVALWDNILYNMERPGVDRLMGTWCLGIVLACWRDDVCTAHLMRIINDKCWWCYCIQASIIGIVNTQHGVYLPNAYTTDFYPACVEFKKKSPNVGSEYIRTTSTIHFIIVRFMIEILRNNKMLFVHIRHTRRIPEYNWNLQWFFVFIFSLADCLVFPKRAQ